MTYAFAMVIAASLLEEMRSGANDRQETLTHSSRFYWKKEKP
ncbi:hypothetical protein [Acetobacter estunensis]|nr:hypothetical protein [Acetobacter estunensis]